MNPKRRPFFGDEAEEAVRQLVDERLEGLGLLPKADLTPGSPLHRWATDLIGRYRKWKRERGEVCP